MPRLDFTSPRLFVAGSLAAGCEIELDKAQSNYLRNVLRLGPGSTVLAFNGEDGEWRSGFAPSGKGGVLRIIDQSRLQPAAPDLVYCFAPLKHARLDYMVQKAVELGVGVLQPVITQRTQVARVNGERMAANVVEAAEQCGVLHVPEVREPLRFDAWLRAWPAERLLVFCDEDAPVGGTIATLRHATSADAPRPLGLLIGPEGGFDPREREALSHMPHVARVSLGPRILRADTAAVAALAVLQAVLGDWRG